MKQPVKTIIDKIKKTIPASLGDRFVYDSESQLNVILDNERFPLAFMTLVDTGTVQDQLGQFKERLTIDMHFATLAEQDMNGEDNERLIDQMKRIALGEWLPALRDAEYIHLVSVNSTRRIYMQFGQYDVILTAYVVNVTIDDNEGFGVCK